MTPFGEILGFFWYLALSQDNWRYDKLSKYDYTILWTNFLVRTQKCLYFYCMTLLMIAAAIFSSIFGGHLMAELQQHRTQSGLGWVTAEKLWNFLFFFFHDSLSFQAFSLIVWPYEFIIIFKWSIFCSRLMISFFHRKLIDNLEQNMQHSTTLMNSNRWK